MQKLQKAGYRVIPVNPRETEILGERSYPSLVDVPERIDIVDVFRRAEDTPAIADEAVTIGAEGAVAADRHRERGSGRARDKGRPDRGDGRAASAPRTRCSGCRQRTRGSRLKSVG